MTGAVLQTLPTGRWQLQTAFSSARFTVSNLGVRTVHGQVPIREAWVDVDQAGRPISLAATLELDRIDTGNRRRDADLRKPNLLDLERYPLLMFTADSIFPGVSGWVIAGTLAGRGREVPLELTAQITARGEDGPVTVAADAVLDRRALAVRAPRLMIGAVVRVQLHAVFSVP